MGKISVVVNTFNESASIARALGSVKWADEVLVCDMHSVDETVKIAKSLGARVVMHKWVSFVEAARNFALSKASGDWVLVLDPDEEIPGPLAKKLRGIAGQLDPPDFVEIPRQNIIFGRFMKASMWWPDYNIRFFKKGAVSWSGKIHRPPQTTGRGLRLPPEEDQAIVHYHYNNISQFLQRMDRYTGVQAGELVREGYKFSWQDLIAKPVGEFLGRFFASRGFDDGLHGLALSLLQAYSFLVVYLKVWEKEKFTPRALDLEEVRKVTQQAGREIDYWLNYVSISSNPLKSFLQRAARKLTR